MSPSPGLAALDAGRLGRGPALGPQHPAPVRLNT